MVESNKVLSVSYGTFSCRLEGFEDSVETMKTVVSYFHELAGHNRFMDMDPQAPDLDELASLTVETDGDEIDATMDEGEVSLRVQRPAEPAAEDAPAVRIPLRVPKPVVVEEEVGGFDDEEFEAEVDVSPEAEVDLAEEVATPDPVLDTPAPVLEEVAEDEPFEAFDDDAAEDVEAEDQMPEAEDLVAEADAPVEDEDDFAGEDDFAEDAASAPVAEDDYEDEDETPFYEPAAASPSAESDDSVAAKLERIRSLVGRTPPAGHKPAASADAPAAIGVMARLSELTGKPQTDEEEDDLDDDLVDDFNFKSEEESPLVLANEDDLEDDDIDLEDSNVTALEDVFDDVADEDDVEFSEIAQEDEDDEPVEQDEDLAADIAAAEADVATLRDGTSKRVNFPDNDDDAMSRIMSQADERLNEPEGRRHRDAFAQLKAAVAATEAARQLGDEESEKDPKDAFREDLDDAVSQSAAEAGADKAEAGEEAPKPVGSPLKLVAEQRIEEEEKAASAAPADRLRQIAAVKEADPTAPTGFAEFAASQGATDLGDLLEAAAAYISFVEGDEDFSRPQVMKKVQSAATEEFSREDGLRSFGRLLRQSRIVKLSNGRFQVAQDTRFRPTNQAAQG